MIYRMVEYLNQIYQLKQEHLLICIQESEEPSVGHREVYFDIEVEVTDGFPDPNKAENKITAIALYDKTMDKYSCFILGNVPNTDVVESFQIRRRITTKVLSEVS